MSSLIEEIEAELKIYNQRVCECLHNDTKLNTVLYKESERTLMILCSILIGKDRVNEVCEEIRFSGFAHFLYENLFYNLDTTKQE